MKMENIYSMVFVPFFVFVFSVGNFYINMLFDKVAIFF